MTRQLALIIVFVALMLAVPVWVAAAQPTTYPPNPPAWYNTSLSAGRAFIFYWEYYFVHETLGFNYTVYNRYNYGFTEEVKNSTYGQFLNYWAGTSNITLTFPGPTNVTIEGVKVYEKYAGDIKWYKIYVDGVEVWNTTENTFDKISFTAQERISILGYASHASKTRYYIWITDQYVKRRRVATTTITFQNSLNLTNIINATVRAPEGQAFTYTNATGVWLDEAYIDAPGTYVFSWAPYFELVPPQNENRVEFHYNNGSMFVFENMSDSFVVGELPLYINYSDSSGWYKVAAPRAGEKIAIADVSGDRVWVTFTVNDYGQNFELLAIYTQTGEIVWREQINALSQAAALLVPYNSYVVSLIKNDTERAVGLLTVSNTAFTLNVPPKPPEARQPGEVKFSYDRENEAYIVEVNCSNPPCHIELYKTNSSGAAQLVASYDCYEEYCKYSLLNPDPFMACRVSDSVGLLYNAFAGSSLSNGSAWLAPILEYFARQLDLPSLTGDVVIAEKLIVVIFAFLVFWGMSSVANWEIGLMAASALVFFSQFWTGFDLYTSASSLAAFTAVFSYMVKRGREI